LELVLEFSFQVEGADLRDEELEVISEGTREIGIDTTGFQLGYSSWLMGVEAHQVLDHS